MIFVDRYADVLEKICEGIDCSYNDGLLSVMLEFSEPKLIYPNRYDNYNYKSDAFQEALNAYNVKMGTKYHMGTRRSVFNDNPDNDSLSVQPIYRIFSIIELQYIELSDKEADQFMYKINQKLFEDKLPWKLVDGKMIKIDALQFECDVKAKAIEVMKELKTSEPKFQSAYDEFISAIEAYEKNDYQSAINNAGKSYESVLKVILDADRGNADKLSIQYMEQILVVPDTMKKEGFREKVMMALPFVRNNSGADHGAGAKIVVISKPMAKLSINLAASLNTYLIEEYAQKCTLN